MAFQFGQNRLGRRQARNLNGPLGDVKASGTVFLVWMGGIAIAAILIGLLVFAFGEGNDAGAKTLPTSREALQNLYQPAMVDGDRIVTYQNGQLVEAHGDTIKGETYYRRICIGCHYGGYTYVGQTFTQPNGPNLAHLYGQIKGADGKTNPPSKLTNGNDVTDSNVLQFILKGHSNMPAGIPLAQQAIDLVAFLKARTSATWDGQNP